MSAVAADLMEEVLRRNNRDVSVLNERTRDRFELLQHVLRMLDDPGYLQALEDDAAVTEPGRPAAEILAAYL